jgi:hypothetical protein
MLVVDLFFSSYLAQSKSTKFTNLASVNFNSKKIAKDIVPSHNVKILILAYK